MLSIDENRSLLGKAEDFSPYIDGYFAPLYVISPPPQQKKIIILKINTKNFLKVQEFLVGLAVKNPALSLLWLGSCHGAVSASGQETSASHRHNQREKKKRLVLAKGNKRMDYMMDTFFYLIKSLPRIL